MSLNLLLDEDSQAKHLVNLLRGVGHDVITVNDAGLGGLPDNVVFEYARQHKRVIITRNCDDFLELHQVNQIHAGILAVYQNSDVLKNMSYQSISKAIANLKLSGYNLENQFIILNQWNWS